MFAKIPLVALMATAAAAASTNEWRAQFDNGQQTKSAGQAVTLQEAKLTCDADNETGEVWTVEGIVRDCNKDDTECIYKYSIATEKTGDTPYECDYAVHDQNGVPASQRTVLDSHGVECGTLHITHEWYEAVDDKPAYTVVCANYPKDTRRIFPSWDDGELKNGNVNDDSDWCVQTYVEGQ